MTHHVADFHINRQSVAFTMIIGKIGSQSVIRHGGKALIIFQYGYFADNIEICKIALTKPLYAAILIL